MKDKILTSVFGVPQERIDALRDHNKEEQIHMEYIYKCTRNKPTGVECRGNCIHIEGEDFMICKNLRIKEKE